MRSFLIATSILFLTWPALSDTAAVQRQKYAEAQMSAGHYQQVINTLSPYTDTLGGHELMVLANAFSKTQNFKSEVDVLRTLTAKYKGNFEPQMLLGQALLKEAQAEKDPDRSQKLQTEAIQTLRKCLKLKPKFKPAYDQLVKALLLQKDHNDARELLRDGLKKFGERPELLKELCRIDSLDGYLSEAIKNCTRAIKSSPDYPDNYVYLTQSLYDQKSAKQAEQEIIKAAGHFPKSEFVQWAAGTLFLKKKNFPVAGRYFAQAVRADSSSGRAQFGLAQALYGSGKERQALAYFKSACRLQPSSIDTFFSDGERLELKGDLALASEYRSAALGCQR